MKREFKPGNMLYPLPAVLVSVADGEGHENLFTAAWAGTVCTNPPMVSVSVRPERFSYRMMRETGEFVINLTTESMARAVDFCGVRSGRDTDKWKETGLLREPARTVRAPLVAQSPVNIECRVTEVLELGSHHMFLARVEAVSVSEEFFDEKDSFRLSDAKLLAYSHGRYYGLGECLGSFGYSVRRREGAAGRQTAVGGGRSGPKTAAAEKKVSVPDGARKRPTGMASKRSRKK